MSHPKICGISEFGGSIKQALQSAGNSCADEAHQYLSSLEPLSDEDLLKQEIKAEEARLLGQLPSAPVQLPLTDAVTLLRLLPSIATKSRTTTHRIAMMAGRIVRKAHDSATSQSDKSAYAKVLKKSGQLCFKSNMRIGVNGNQRSQECALFGPFIQNTEEFKSFQKSKKRRSKGTPICVAKEEVVISHFGSNRAYARYLTDTMDYARV